MPQFTHLHVHSHYSMLDGMSKIPDLVAKAKRCGMYSLALTDHGNMFGIKDFLDTVKKENGKVKDRIKELENEIDTLLSQPQGADSAPTFGEQQGEQQERLKELREELEKVKGQIFRPIVGTEAYCARRTLYDKDKDVKELKGGVLYKVIKEGTGAIPSDTSMVKVQYEGKTIDGNVFDSSYKRNEPVKLRANQVIPGWTEALTHMPVGSVWEVVIPQDKAYGAREQKEIKPFSALIFKIELLGIEK